LRKYLSIGCGEPVIAVADRSPQWQTRNRNNK